MFDRLQLTGLKDSLNQDLEQRVIEHRNRFVYMFMGRYRELLPSLIIYKNIEDTQINQMKLEYMLRNNYDVVVGKTTNDNILIMGYCKSRDSYENPTDIFHSDLLNKNDIDFVIADDLIPTHMKEISRYDDCSTGNFVVLKNKALNIVSDRVILEHYTIELAEIVLSRFSISMQAKVNTFFIGNKNDETINELVKKLYNGSPFVKVSKFFDPEENIHTIENQFLASNFVELKREYQNKVSELNNMLGINSLAVEKSSGVSDVEAKSNREFTSSNANIYLSSRLNDLDKLNKRFSLNLKPIFNDEVSSELQRLAYIEGLEGDKNDIN